MKKICSLFIISLMACNSADKRNTRIDQKQMPTIIWHLIMADDFYARQSIIDSNWRLQKKNIDLYQKVFSLHHTTSDQFYFTMDYYEKHPVEFKELMDSVSALTKREKKPIISVK